MTWKISHVRNIHQKLTRTWTQPPAPPKKKEKKQSNYQTPGVEWGKGKKGPLDVITTYFFTVCDQSFPAGKKKGRKCELIIGEQGGRVTKKSKKNLKLDRRIHPISVPSAGDILAMQSVCSRK